MTKEKALQDLEETLKRGVKSGKLNDSHLLALNMFLDADEYPVPEMLARKYFRSVIKQKY